MKTVISNDPAPIGERCFLCEEALTPPWFKTGKFRMHIACRDLVREDFEATHRRRLINPKTANDNIKGRAPRPSEAGNVGPGPPLATRKVGAVRAAGKPTRND